MPDPVYDSWKCDVTVTTPFSRIDLILNSPRITVESTQLREDGFLSHSRYIRSPLYDHCWIILSPLWAIGFGYLMSMGLFQSTVKVFDTSNTSAFFFYMALTQAHLFITIFRTHFNPRVFKRFPIRFTAIPLLIWAAAYSNLWIFALLFVLMTFWDVYHSSLQVFGIGRIYDRKAGNPPESGRRSDLLICVLMYAGPVLSGALLLVHMEAFTWFDGLDDLIILGEALPSYLFTDLPYEVARYQSLLQNVVMGTSLLIVSYYVYTQIQLSRNGYKPSLLKLTFFGGTAVSSVFAWGFNSFGMGFLIANVFHAVQYFALIWVEEEKTLTGVFGRRPSPRLILYLSIPLILGLLSISLDSHFARTTLMVCALMHFWWDGFIWSVRTSDGLKG